MTVRGAVTALARTLATTLALVCVAGCGGTDGGASAVSDAAGVEVTHDTGTVTPASTPQRIVTTSDETTELVVALGLQPVGAGSTRVDAAADDPFGDYYIAADSLGDPAFVGGSDIGLEAVAALEPELIVHGYDDEIGEALAGIAPTVVFDIERPGAWQEALVALGEATDRSSEAREALDAYEADVARAADALAEVAERYPQVAVLYPEYRGGADNYLFGPEFALAAVLPDLGFRIGGSDRAEEAFPGVQSISPELYSTIAADAVLALGVRPWQETSSAATLEALDVPVVAVPLENGQPSAGPLTSPDLVRTYEEALTALASGTDS